MSFSERMGFKAARDVMQLDWMDQPLRIAIYNHLHAAIIDNWSDARGYSAIGWQWGRVIWTEFMRRPVSDATDNSYVFAQILESQILECPWYEVYDLLEFCASIRGFPVDQDRLNYILERDMSGYRMRAGRIVAITDEVELSVIDEALEIGGDFGPARQHIVEALAKMSQKPEPDLRNAITEAVSAVESAARIVTGNRKATLADALVALERGGRVHPALKAAWLKLYGYTSDEHGLRHAMTEDPNIDFATAKYMVVSCSAFVNLLASSV